MKITITTEIDVQAGTMLDVDPYVTELPLGTLIRTSNGAIMMRVNKEMSRWIGDDGYFCNTIDACWHSMSEILYLPEDK